jgi:adenylate cyclase
MVDIFVSYATEDRHRIEPLVDLFERQGWSVWWDRELFAGPSFEEKIQEALDDAKCVVVAWSERSVKSPWCRDEAQEGLQRGALVPLRIDDVRPPLGFRSSQTASLIGWPQQRSELDSVFAGIREVVGHGSPTKATLTRSAERAIAVLPFRNLTNDPEQEFFSEGIAEDILNELARTARGLVVRPPSSSFSLKGKNLSVEAIGDRLGVSHVLEGSVRRAGNRIRVTAQLSEVATNRSIWSDRYDREMADIFEVQDEITSKILAGLNVHFQGQRGSRKFVGTEAYEAFLRGLHHSRRNEFSRADKSFEEAVTLNPTNADAWAERARIRGHMMSLGLIPNTGSYRQQRKDFCERALEIDSSHWAVAHRAVYTFIEDRQYQRAIDQLVETVRANPNSWGAVMYLTFALGGVDRLSEAYYRAARRYSLLTEDFSVEAVMLLDSGRVEEARNVIEGLRWGKGDLAAQLAAMEGDADRLEALIDDAQVSRARTTYFASLVPYLKGDFDEACKIISSDKSVEGYQPFLIKHEIALVERELVLAAEYYAKAVDAAEPAAMFWHRDTSFLNRVFPEFVAYPPYQRTLKRN